MIKTEEPAGQRLLNLLRGKHLTLSSAESCTGGMISSFITSIAGSSDVYSGGIVSYTNLVKNRMLGVAESTLQQYGAVSEQCAGEMAAGAAKQIQTEVAFSVTGIAGPTGGTKLKPVGTVCFGFYIEGKIVTETCLFAGDRSNVRRQSALHVIARLLELLKDC
ncbi:MAG: CinA family protein [Spirochaetaceae bacterium]|nr:CinA family protein [Spirochaetaceae bacterium]